MTAPDEQTPSASTIRCNQCGNDVPRTNYCIRCGDPLSDEYSTEGRTEARRHFAAAPTEPLRTVAFVSTLFPQLPHAEMRVFRICFLAGLGIIGGLALLGYYPVALVSAAVLVPLLMVLYVYVVDIYEDEPLSAVGATLLWGVAAAVVYSLLQRVLPGESFNFTGPDAQAVLIHGLAMPLLALVLMLAGPLFLLPQRRFNDVLDGATFGASSAVAFVGTSVIIQWLPVLGAGLRPAGDPLPWIVQLVSIGVLQPVIGAGAVGATAAAFWLRYRSPVTDRKALGPLGMPVVAILAAGLLLVVSGMAQELLPLIPASIILAVLAGIALLWLRSTLHLGLAQESREISVHGSMTCPNCGHTTLVHTFCGHCGISLRALPKSGARRSLAPPAAPQPETETPQ